VTHLRLTHDMGLEHGPGKFKRVAHTSQERLKMKGGGGREDGGQHE